MAFDRKHQNNRSKLPTFSLECEVPTDLLASEWLDVQDVSVETRAYLVESVLPQLILAAERLLIDAQRRGAITIDDGSSVNPVIWLAQYLMRNNPRYSNFGEASPYMKLLADVQANLKERVKALALTKSTELAMKNERDMLAQEKRKRAQARDRAKRCKLHERAVQLLALYARATMADDSIRTVISHLQDSLERFVEETIEKMGPQYTKKNVVFAEDLEFYRFRGSFVGLEFVSYINYMCEAFSGEAWELLIIYLEKVFTQFTLKTEEELPAVTAVEAMRRLLLNKLFRKWDENGNGFIEKKELVHLLSSFPTHRNYSDVHREVTAALNLADSNDDERLDEEEYIIYMERLVANFSNDQARNLINFMIRQCDRLANERQETIRDLFSVWDYDKSGFIEMRELQGVMARFDDTTLVEALENSVDVMEQVDANHDSKLNSREFVDYIDNLCSGFSTDAFGTLIMRLKFHCKAFAADNIKQLEDLFDELDYRGKGVIQSREVVDTLEKYQLENASDPDRSFAQPITIDIFSCDDDKDADIMTKYEFSDGIIKLCSSMGANELESVVRYVSHYAWMQRHKVNSVEKLFNLWDTDNSGFIDQEELQNVMIDFKNDDSNDPIRKACNFIRSADTSGDGRLDKTELIEHMLKATSSLTEEEFDKFIVGLTKNISSSFERKRKLDELFQHWDNDGSGRISMDELYTRLNRYHVDLNVKSDFLSDFLRDYDHSKAATTLDAAGFLSFLVKLCHGLDGDQFDKIVDYLLRATSVSSEMELRGQLRKRWLNDLGIWSSKSVLNEESFFRAFFGVLHSDAKKHGKNKRLNITVCVVDEEMPDYVRLVSSSNKTVNTSGSRVRLDSDLPITNTISSGKPVYIEDIGSEESANLNVRPFSVEEISPRRGSLLTIPFLSKSTGRSFGALCVDTVGMMQPVVTNVIGNSTMPYFFEKHEIGFYNGVCDKLAICMERSVMCKKAAKVAASSFEWMHAQLAARDISLFFLEDDVCSKADTESSGGPKLRKVSSSALSESGVETRIHDMEPFLERSMSGSAPNDYLFDAIDNASDASISSDTFFVKNRRGVCALPIINEVGKVVAVVKVNLGPDRRLSEEDIDHMRQYSRTLGDAYGQLEKRQQSRAKSRVSDDKALDECGLDEDAWLDMLFDRVLLKECRARVSRLDKAAFAELKSYTVPPKLIHQILKCSMYIFGYKPSQVRKWKNARRFINPTLAKLIALYDPTSKQKKVRFQRVRRVMRTIDASKVSARTSVPAQAMFLWQQVTLDLRKRAVEARKRLATKNAKALDDDDEDNDDFDDEFGEDDDEDDDTDI